MAFTKKFAKKAAPNAAASYARKKRQEEEIEAEEVEGAEEVEEVEAETEQEEVQDDYGEQEAEPAPAPRRTGFSRPSAPSRQAQAPRQFASGGNVGNGEQKKALRLTGLFAGKREGCFSGKLRSEDAQNLAALIEEATATNQQVVFFLWENQGNPQFSLTANISAPKQFGNGNRGRGGWQGNRGNWGNGGFRKRW